ncbi:GNAT family N-acetyltransferase [cf. Phormidesmis sp. LEGE 11477]|uniref:GNAT family N-acetyltransferase n=1 Tax=cf. Phormidesmis sp. LEGE 11477 TaxID=1828680 RepID=UPI0018825F61|nr:GNAT family N-acetyltransferase [cf. Phormidesmis sp. LEGE 11477]MBE9062741.1 N-acetyltransferase [cf. Phormidesmis sp. LEGE 11477]
MTRRNSQNTELSVRSVHLRDLDTFVSDGSKEVAFHDTDTQAVEDYVQQMRRWYGPVKALSLFPSPLKHLFSTFVAEANGRPQGMIQVSPFNRTLSTWKVDRILVNLAKSQAKAVEDEQASSDQADNKLTDSERVDSEPQLHLSMDVGSQLLRHCFEHIREAQYWISETDVNDQFGLALYRQNGFQPLAKATYWSIQPEQLASLSERDPDLPNLLPVSNADAQLIYQLETVSIPPLVRQVLDYQIHDFKTTLSSKVKTRFVRWMHKKETVSAYVFEPQRKTAIGYFELKLCRDGMTAHSAKLTVHPAYTWLYPELMAQMAGVVQKFPNQPLRLLSLDYQTEREAYLRQIGALEIDHTLMMSRSVWHKVREAKAGALEGLKMPDVLPGLQPTGSPLPGRFSWRGANLGPALDDPSGDRLAWDRFSLEKISRLSADQRLADADSEGPDAGKEG